MQDSIHAMLVALCAVCIGVAFNQLGSSSIFISVVGIMFIMGGFVIGVTAFLLFMREWILKYGD